MTEEELNALKDRADELTRLKRKHNKLVKDIRRIRDYNYQFINDLSGSEVSDALYYTTEALLKDL